jgi:hypothetical protein
MMSNHTDTLGGRLPLAVPRPSTLDQVATAHSTIRTRQDGSDSRLKPKEQKETR